MNSIVAGTGIKFHNDIFLYVKLEKKNHALYLWLNLQQKAFRERAPQCITKYQVSGIRNISGVKELTINLVLSKWIHTSAAQLIDKS